MILEKWLMVHDYVFSHMEHSHMREDELGE